MAWKREDSGWGASWSNVALEIRYVIVDFYRIMRCALMGHKGITFYSGYGQAERECNRCGGLWVEITEDTEQATEGYRERAKKSAREILARLHRWKNNL